MILIRLETGGWVDRGFSVQFEGIRKASLSRNRASLQKSPSKGTEEMDPEL